MYSVNPNRPQTHIIAYYIQNCKATCIFINFTQVWKLEKSKYPLWLTLHYAFKVNMVSGVGFPINDLFIVNSNICTKCFDM